MVFPLSSPQFLFMPAPLLHFHVLPLSRSYIFLLFLPHFPSAHVIIHIILYCTVLYNAIFSQVLLCSWAISLALSSSPSFSLPPFFLSLLPPLLSFPSPTPSPLPQTYTMYRLEEREKESPDTPGTLKAVEKLKVKIFPTNYANQLISY